MKREFFNKTTEVNVHFERVADDLLMVSLTDQVGGAEIPSYWRMTKTKGVPPLEIGVSQSQGMIISITFFIDGSAIGKDEKKADYTKEGKISVDTTIFKKENDYYDNDQSYEINLCEDRLLCYFIKSANTIVAYRNGRVEVYADSENRIVGFSVCNLTPEDKCLIESIKMPQIRQALLN